MEPKSFLDLSQDTIHHLWIMSFRHQFKIADYEVVSQHPSILSAGDRRRSVEHALPAFIRCLVALERQTGHRWKITSYIRDSPSHSLGLSIDFAPHFLPGSDESMYAAYRGSDPVLYKRTELWRSLKRISKMPFCSVLSPYKLGIFVEPDHLHVQIFPEDDFPFATLIAKWKGVKSAYADSAIRSNLPIFLRGAPVADVSGPFAIG